ncbi:MAG: helix-turn-helix domain-containing protein [Patescibacteria group bacterium]
MPTSIPREIKEQILARIKQGDTPTAQIAREHGVNPKTVYGWLEAKVERPANLIELNRLKREQAGLYQLIGKLTSVIEQQKKGR